MEWKLDKNRAICPQICEQVCLRIALGEFAPGEKLLSVREVALAAGVNPNTVQHSFEILEQKSILYSQRGSGWFVSEDISAAKRSLDEMIAEKTREYFAAMDALGISGEETKKYVENWKDAQI
ncbi:MAG: GntR family transcriptional regulator [Clostridia bacterium]|nr:GntR family transcriptional regulator [Clostridia bacterium]MBR3715561.1 GntR family transcriptional regulator [Clostridia bacterium]